MSEEAAARRAEAERESDERVAADAMRRYEAAADGHAIVDGGRIVWQLSERELQMVFELGRA